MIDYSRVAKTVNLGIHDVDPSATIEAGAPLKLGASGLALATAGGADFFGVAFHNKTTGRIGAVVQEQITLTGTTAINLAHADLIADQIKVTNLAGTTTYTEGAGSDYTVSDTNGTVTRVAGGTITDGQAVLVTYNYNKTTAEIELEGKNFDNTLDDTAGSGKMSLLQSFAVFYTDRFDSAAAFTKGGALTVGAGGTYKVKGGGDTQVGICISVPTPTDPYLGVQIG